MIMDIRPIQTPADHQATLKEISALMERDPEPGTPDGDRLDMLVTLAQAYEARHTPMETPGSVNAVGRHGCRGCAPTHCCTDNCHLDMSGVPS